MTNEDVERVRQRYLQLGREGTSSVITLHLPEGIEKFEHEIFYASVDEQLAGNQSKR
jgi:hypothetical protein